MCGGFFTRFVKFLFQLKALQKRVQKDVNRFIVPQAVPDIYRKNERLKNRGDVFFCYRLYGCNTQSRDGLEALTPFFSSCFSLRCFVQIIDTSEKRKTKENSTKKPFKDKGITFCNQKDTSIRLITNKSLRYYTVAYFDHFHCVHTFFFKFQIKYLSYFILALQVIYKYPSYIQFS